MSERKGIVTIFGNPLTLLGDAVTVGQKAPDFVALDNDLNPKALADFAGKVLIIAAVPSLDTPVCDVETRRFNTEGSKIGENVHILTVSMDLPFAQKRWCAAAGIDRLTTLSDHRDASFGNNWGVLIKELRLLARSVFVVGKDGLVKYMEIVPEVTSEPDYDAALSAAKALV
ncbi:MAG: thiol peroxidase [Desulfovibrio sp.]|jgi:thiol peroxidase|nr:thiol peroxidase [Desulfovibrio sp.]MBI4959042.1 thiol peroxidase [Desulfovibrio sp.]